jgi:hypothetical protein
VLNCPLSRIQSAARWALFKTLFLFSRRSVIDGIEVIDVAGEESERTIGSLRKALQLLETTDPGRYQRLRRDLRRIALLKAGGPEFAPEVRACVLRSRYVRESDPAGVAATLVHEAAHARLWRRGVRENSDSRPRVEEICVNEQIAFAERLGNPDMLNHLRDKLQRPWWTQAQLHERRITAWRHLGMPDWTLRWYERLIGAGRDSDRSAKGDSSRE